MSFKLSSVHAKTYEVISVGAIHEEIVSLGVYNLVVTPIYATDVLEDTANGTLRFKVLPNIYPQVLGASTNISDAPKPINALPILKFLQENDTVEINFKDCQYSQNSVERIPSTENYEIRYAGQANSVIINAITIPEFPEIFCSTTLTAVIMAVSMFLTHRIEKSRTRH